MIDFGRTIFSNAGLSFIGIPEGIHWLLIPLMPMIGGLIIGVGEKIAEIYWGPLVGGAIENWFAYVLALAFLLFRPQGLFGERIIERV